jgi:hypothetical protein
LLSFIEVGVLMMKLDPLSMTFGNILVTLLIKLGLIASLASIIARVGGFRRLLFIEQRSPRQKLVFSAFWACRSR